VASVLSWPPPSPSSHLVGRPGILHIIEVRRRRRPLVRDRRRRSSWLVPLGLAGMALGVCREVWRRGCWLARQRRGGMASPHRSPPPGSAMTCRPWRCWVVVGLQPPCWSDPACVGVVVEAARAAPCPPRVKPAAGPPAGSGARPAALHQLGCAAHTDPGWTQAGPHSLWQRRRQGRWAGGRRSCRCRWPDLIPPRENERERDAVQLPAPVALTPARPPRAPHEGLHPRPRPFLQDRQPWALLLWEAPTLGRLWRTSCGRWGPSGCSGCSLGSW